MSLGEQQEANKSSTYGVGVEWSFEMEKTFEQNLHKLCCFELIPENFFKQGEGFLQTLAESELPTVIHGVELSFGSDEPLKQVHFDKMIEVGERVNCVMLSEHLSMTESGGVEIGQLTPLNWSVKLADSISRKIETIQKQVGDRLNVPFAIENVTNRFMVPDTELTETQFINQILRQTGCGFQLDLNNIDTNGYNFGFSPFEWLEEIDMSKVCSVHLAGGVFDEDGVLLDSHSAPVRNRVWDLYRYVCERVIPETTIVEWTDDCPSLEVLLEDVHSANKILGEALSERKTPSTAVERALASHVGGAQ